MSKNKAKLQKKRKPMSPQAKRNLGNSFKSLISNQACIDGAKEAPWWIATIFFVLAIILPVIPITVNLSKAYGSSFVYSNNYGSDRGLYITSKEFKSNNYDFVVKDDNLLHFYQDGLELVDAQGNPTLDSVVMNDIYVDTTNNIKYFNFRLFITSYTGDTLTEYVNSLADAKFKNGTIDPAGVEVNDDNKDQFYTPGFMVLAPDTMFMATYKNQSTERVGTTAKGLNWVKTPSGSLLDRVLKVEDTSYLEPDKIADVFYNWRMVLDETYLNARDTQMLNSSLLYLGVYAGLVLFLGLMIFLLTRGKNNQFRYLNLWVCQKISWWASFTPGVLGMILGFIITGNIIGQMGFIVLVSLRVMWLSMRQLRPM